MGWYKRDEGGDNPGMYSPAPAPFPYQTSLVVNNVSMAEHAGLVTVVSQSLNTSCGELTSSLTFSSAGNTSLGPAFTCNVTATTYLSRQIPTIAAMDVELACSPPTVSISIAPNLVKPVTEWSPDPDPVIVDLPDYAHFTPKLPGFDRDADSTLEAVIGLRHPGQFQQPFSSLGVASSVLRRPRGPGALTYHVATAMVSSRYTDLPIETSMRPLSTAISLTQATNPISPMHQSTLSNR